ncbi:hypothetical protein [Saltatorellus ferox]
MVDSTRILAVPGEYRLRLYHGKTEVFHDVTLQAGEVRVLKID